ncbi:unnamed protein product [Clavelina lepadiformis]|uniref:C-type lectin domain-containing protein n=1 Tax=Clavelina lepadiformis TaxID=159417 RepID=A0ABP0H011_CLALP
MWNDGVKMTRANAGWLHNEPNNQNGNEDCAAISRRSSTLLNDGPCSASLYGLCEKRVKSCLNIFSVLYLTGLRNNDAFHYFTNPEVPSNIRCPPGQPYKRGRSGEKGEKGPQGVPCLQDEEEIT